LPLGQIPNKDEAIALACSPPPPSMRTSSWMRVSPLTG
jgi:hypothetical protein